MKNRKTILNEASVLLIAMIMITSVLTIVPSVKGQDYTLILDLTISDTARVVDYDNGIYVVGTSTGDLYIINDDGAYTVTDLAAGCINDVRIENGFIAVAAGQTVIELELDGLTPTELWRTTDATDWYQVVSTDLSEDGNYVCYFAQRWASYDNSGEIGVLYGGGTGGGLISKQYTSGWRPTNAWLDATGDMEYIAASHPTYPPYYHVGIGLYHFDGSTLTFQWWTFLVDRYEVTEVRVSENKDYVAAATSSGVYMKLLRLSDGAVLGSYETLNQEQYACDGDDNLNYVIGANQAWSPPYNWFILKNLGESGYELITQGQMNGAINDIDSTQDGAYFAFGSDAGEVILLERTGDTVGTVFTIDGLNFIDSIEIGSNTLLVGGYQFIHLYAFLHIDINVDIKPGSCPNPINYKDNGLVTIAICGTEDFDVTTIDPTSIRLKRTGVGSSVEPVRWNYEDAATPFTGNEGCSDCCGCHTLTGDGYQDLVLKFKVRDVINTLSLVLDSRENIPLTITGKLKKEYDGTPIEGQDCVLVLFSRNVGVIDIISPFSGVPQTFSPEVIVKNFGTKTEKNVPVNLVISSAGVIEYNKTVKVDIGVGETIHVIFPDWTPQAWHNQENVDIDYTITACSKLTGDEKPGDNCVSKVITLHYPYFHDVSVTEIISPTSGPAQTFTPEVTVKNFGQYDETNVPVNLMIAQDLFFFKENFSSGVPPSGWTDEHKAVASNYGWSTSSSSYSGGTSPEALLPYYCALAEKKFYSPAIDTTGYTTAQLSFSSYINHYSGQGMYTLKAAVSNDNGVTWSEVWSFAPSSSQQFTVEVPITGGSAQTRIAFYFVGDPWYFNYWYIDNVGVKGVVLNTDYDQTVAIDIHRGETLHVTFPDWTPQAWHNQESVNIDYTITASTMMTSDGNPSNDCVSKVITLHYPFFHDVGVTEIISPISGPSQTFTPEVTIKNFGQYDETNVPVNFKIEKLNLIMYEGFEVWPLADWTFMGSGSVLQAPGKVGSYALKAYAYGYGYYNDIITPVFDGSSGGNTLTFWHKQLNWAGDQDNLYIYVSNDGGVSYNYVNAWTLNMDWTFETIYLDDYITPSATMRVKFYAAENYGYGVYIDDVSIKELLVSNAEYNQTVTIDILAGETLNVAFPSWTPSDIGYYVITACTQLATDGNLVNNCKTETITLE
jgi:hypothetical protein